MHYILDATWINGHKVRIQFENGQIRVADLADHLDGPIFEPLRDETYFRKMTVNKDIDTIVWPNGADFSPDFLYEVGEPVGNST